MEIRIDEGEVIRTHLSETVGVFVDERGLKNGINSARRVEIDNNTAINGRSSGVVGPLRRACRVANGEEESLDSVRETDVVAWLGVGGGSEGLTWGSLNLLNENVAGSTAHLFTLIVGDNGVVGPNLSLANGGSTSDQISNLSGSTGDSTSKRSDVINDKKLGPIAEAEVDAHFIVGKGGSGKSDTAVTSIEERKGKIESEGWNSDTSGVRASEVIEITNHVVVTVALASGNREGSPEVEMVTVEPRGDKVVEGDAALTAEIVHQIAGPAETTIGSELITGSQSDSRNSRTEPRLEKIITSTRDCDTPLITESGLTRCAGKDHGNLSEPRCLANFADEVDSGVRATIHVFLYLIESSEIDEPTCDVRSADGCHWKIL